jgi:cysteine desulfurase/selenocysteine lyase
MIREVRFSGTTFADVPHKFEAGTPNIAGFVGLAAAIDYLHGLDLAAAHAWEQELLAYATGRLGEIPSVRIFGTAPDKVPVLSFLLEGAQATDLATLLDLQGVAVRSGHHCAHPLMQFFGVPATLRASFAFYNTREEVDAFVAALRKVRKLLA